MRSRASRWLGCSMFYEVYRDRESFQTHETAEHVIDFHARKNPFVVSHRVEFLSPASAKGLDL